MPESSNHMCLRDAPCPIIIPLCIARRAPLFHRPSASAVVLGRSAGVGSVPCSVLVWMLLRPGLAVASAFFLHSA